MFQTALAIPASIPTYTLNFGDGLVIALLVILCVGAAVLAHAALTAQGDAKAVGRQLTQPSPWPRPIAPQRPEARPLARSLAA